MKKFRLFAKIFSLQAILLLASFPCPSLLHGQDNANRGSRAMDQAGSRADQEAQRMVSLSPEKIISILQQEPGLLLEVKKVYVRKAYEQGRVIDPQDLTDDAFYRLIERDETVRVLATRQIEDRQYVRVKPTREELERERQRRGIQALTANSAQEEAYAKSGKSQEDTYWSQ